MNLKQVLFLVCCLSCWLPFVSLQSCSKKEEELSKKGVCSENDVQFPCRSLCDGKLITGAESCKATSYCCLVNDNCVLKNIAFQEKDILNVLKNEEKVSENMYHSAQVLMGENPDNAENLQRRSVAEKWKPFNRSKVPDVLEARNMGSMGGNQACSTFPFNCKIPRNAMGAAYQNPDINIPYCQRIACQSNNIYLEMNQALCLSVPGCAFDTTLYQYRQYFGQVFMPNAPICHQAIRNQAFIMAATHFILQYHQPAWNPIFNRCLLDDKKEEIFRNPPGCEMILLLENLGHSGKYAGWKGITQRECHLIGACWLNHACRLPARQNGEAQIPSANDIGEVGRNFGDASCLPISETDLTLADNYHKCLSAGCAIKIDDAKIRDNIETVGRLLLPAHLQKRFSCMVKSGQVRPDNYHQVIKDMTSASSISAETILGSVPLTHLGMPYSAIKVKDSFTDPQSLELLIKGSEIPELDCDDIKLNSTVSMPSHSPMTFCPFKFRQYPGLPPLPGRVDGCCDLPLCYIPRYLVALSVEGVSSSGIASYLTPWTAWSRCSVTCGQGVQERKRRCVSEKCTGKLNDFQTCNEDACDSRQHAITWSEYSACNRNCWKYRTKKCFSNQPCQKPLMQSVQCSPQECMQHIHYPWSAWTVCKAGCANGSPEVGLQTRKRIQCYNKSEQNCKSKRYQTDHRSCLGQCSQFKKQQ